MMPNRIFFNAENAIDHSRSAETFFERVPSEYPLGDPFPTPASPAQS
jgi:hypothetical protein